MLERKKVRAANEDLPVIMEMNAASKMKQNDKPVLYWKCTLCSGRRSYGIYQPFPCNTDGLRI